MLPLGHAEKLFLTLADPEAIPNDEHLIGNSYSGRMGSYRLRPQGGPVIEAFLGGKTALDLAEEGADAISALRSTNWLLYWEVIFAGTSTSASRRVGRGSRGSPAHTATPCRVMPLRR